MPSGGVRQRAETKQMHVASCAMVLLRHEMLQRRRQATVHGEVRAYV